MVNMRLQTLDRKLLRDLWQLRGQVITIALVVASGIAAFCASLSAYESLKSMQAAYYESARFAHVFVQRKRAPDSMAAKLLEIPGVADAETTITRDVLLDLPGVLRLPHGDLAPGWELSAHARVFFPENFDPRQLRSCQKIPTPLKGTLTTFGDDIRYPVPLASRTMHLTGPRNNRAVHEEEHPQPVPQEDSMNTVIPLFAQTPRSAAHVPSDTERCTHCPSNAQCWSGGGEAKAEFRFARRRIKRGQSLYRMGESFHSLYSVRSGTLKSRTLLEDGRDQVTGFHMNGELLGIDGIGTQQYQTDCIALEDSEVCILPYEQVLSLAHLQPQMMSSLYRTMSQEIVREQSLMALLGSMQADERVAAFLLNLSARLQDRGFSAARFLLRMTREEIGSYLGLKLETVSRVFSRLQSSGHIKVESNRQITILNATGLKTFSAASPAARPATHPHRPHTAVRATPLVSANTPARRPAMAYG